jgi:hypothetical protein
MGPIGVEARNNRDAEADARNVERGINHKSTQSKRLSLAQLISRVLLSRQGLHENIRVEY